MTAPEETRNVRFCPSKSGGRHYEAEPREFLGACCVNRIAAVRTVGQ